MISYYQRALLAFLADYSLQSVEELNQKYGVKLFLRWRRLIKKVEVTFELPDFYRNQWEYSFTDSQCNKKEPPLIIHDQQRFDVLRDLIEFSKISVKQLIENKNTYSIKNRMYNCIYYVLPNQFGFDYIKDQKNNPYTLDIAKYLSEVGFSEINIGTQYSVWVWPTNYLEHDQHFTSGISIHEAEGLFFMGGFKLLDSIITFYQLNLYESLQNIKKK